MAREDHIQKLTIGNVFDAQPKTTIKQVQDVNEPTVKKLGREEFVQLPEHARQDILDLYHGKERGQVVFLDDIPSDSNEIVVSSTKTQDIDETGVPEGQRVEHKAEQELAEAEAVDGRVAPPAYIASNDKTEKPNDDTDNDFSSIVA